MKKQFATAAVVAFLAVCLWAADPKAAQQPSASATPVQQRAEDPITLDVNRVNMLFAVSDKKGRFITNLTKEDFEVTEEKKPQEIVEFAAESDLPLRLAVVIDSSNSIRDRFRFQQEAAVEFINSVVRPQDLAAVISFDTGPELVSDLTNDTAKLAKAVRDLRPGGGTAFYDAVYFACKEKLMLDQPRHKFRRALIVLSDGDDNQSRYTRDQALEMAQKADVVIYGISTNISGIQSDGDKVLKYMASETGGLTFFPFKVQDLSQSFENIANELRHQYSLLYRPNPPKSDGLFHGVNIRTKNRKDLVVRARKGYYAPKM
ncbi:MAG: VWA domain-containing protein [Bryobacteraceae bacterium]|nr:VWA domain-containing protein [Bryobacteraceae bacterium]